MHQLFSFLKNLDRRERSIMGAATFVLISALVLLLTDEFTPYFLGLNSSEQKPVAIIMTLSNDIRRRHDQSVVWMPVKIKSALFENDTIFSGEDSNLEFQFTNDQTKIALRSQTLIKLNQDSHQKNTLSVIHGRATVSLGKNKSLLLTVGGKTVKVTNTDNSTQTEIQINADSSSKENPAVEVISGHVDVKVVESDPAAIALDNTKSFEVPQDVPNITLRGPASSELDPNPAAGPTPEVKLDVKNTVNNEVEKAVPVEAVELSALLHTNIFHFSALLGNSSYSGLTNTGGKFTRASKLDYGAQLGWIHMWDQMWEAGLFFGVLNTDLESSFVQGVVGFPATLFHLGIEAAWRPANRLKFKIKAANSQRMMIGSATEAVARFDRVWIPSVTLKASYDFYKAESLLVGLGFIGAGELPAKGDSYNVNFGTAYGACLVMESPISNTIKIHGEATYLKHTQSTSTTLQSKSEQTIEIGFSFMLDNSKAAVPGLVK